MRRKKKIAITVLCSKMGIMNNNKMGLFRALLLLIFLLCGCIASSVAQESDQSLSNINKQKNVLHQEDVKYVPFPNEFKKYEVYPWEVLKLPDFNKSYQAILGTRIKERWLRRLDGPSTLNKMIATPQGNFIVVNSCKQHYCDTHVIIILFNPVTAQSWTLLVEEEKIIWLGNPDDNMKVLMKKILKIT